jgi:hypothetical protein
VSLSKGAPPLHVGDRILVLANLSPPSGPAAPGAFDFQRVAWYQQLGAVGYDMAPAVVIDHGRPDGIVRFIDGLRADITARILKALPGPEGGVAAALLTGEQTAVDKDINQAMRDSGPGAHPVDLGPAHRVRGRPGDGAAALWHRAGTGGGAMPRRQKGRRRDRASGGAVLLLAAGGIGAGRAMAAALAADADGVRFGTRFLASEEASMHPVYVNALIGARAEDSVYTRAFGWPEAPHRVLRSAIDAAEAFRGRSWRRSGP